MKTWLNALFAEMMKIRRTLALAMTALAPLVIAVLMFGMFIRYRDFYLPVAGENPWVRFTQMTLVYWSLLMLPLFITLETALLAQLDHNRSNWKLLYTQPARREAIYAAKQVVAVGLIAISMAVMVVMMVAAGALLQVLFPQLGLDAPLPWGLIGKYSGLAFLASLGMIAVHLWIATRWRSMVLALAAGIAFTVVALFLIQSDSANYYLWTLPGVVVTEMSDSSPAQWISLGVGVASGLLLPFLAGWDVTRREII